MRYMPIGHPVDAVQFRGINTKEICELVGTEGVVTGDKDTVDIYLRYGAMLQLTLGDYLVRDNRGKYEVYRDSKFKESFKAIRENEDD